MAAEENRFAVQERILRNKTWQDFSEIWWLFLIKTIIPLGLVGYEMIIANSALQTSLLTGPYYLHLLSLAGFRVLFLLSHLMFRSPITDRVWKGTGSLPIVSLVLTRPHLT